MLTYPALMRPSAASRLASVAQFGKVVESGSEGRDIAMTDLLGYRLKVGSLVPSVNSSVEPEFNAMSVPGVTHLAARIRIPNQQFHSDADAQAIVDATQADLLPCVDRLISCNPDRIIMAMAAPCFWGGVEGSDQMQQKLETRAGVPVLLPPDAVATALHALVVRRIAVISPYMPLADQHVQRWFSESGFDVAQVRGLRARSEDEIVNFTPQQLASGFEQVDDASVEALVHVGTSIAMARLVEEFEQQFSKPVVSVNVACWWATLRAAGITDQLAGYGQLMREH